MIGKNLHNGGLKITCIELREKARVPLRQIVKGKTTHSFCLTLFDNPQLPDAATALLLNRRSPCSLLQTPSPLLPCSTAPAPAPTCSYRAPLQFVDQARPCSSRTSSATTRPATTSPGAAKSTTGEWTDELMQLKLMMNLSQIPDGIDTKNASKIEIDVTSFRTVEDGRSVYHKGRVLEW
ncbi:hypothetical protein EJB05_50891, partial [Eragrostis curvula]